METEMNGLIVDLNKFIRLQNLLFEIVTAGNNIYIFKNIIIQKYGIK